MGTIKDRNNMDLTEAEYIKKSGKNTLKISSRKFEILKGHFMQRWAQ